MIRNSGVLDKMEKVKDSRNSVELVGLARNALHQLEVSEDSNLLHARLHVSDVVLGAVELICVCYMCVKGTPYSMEMFF